MSDDFTEIRTTTARRKVRESTPKTDNETSTAATPPPADAAADVEHTSPDGSEPVVLVESAPLAPPRPPTPRVARPPAGAATELREVRPIPTRTTGTTELRRTAQPPPGAATSSGPPRPPAQAAPPAPPPAPLSELQAHEIKRLAEVCLAYSAENVSHPSSAVVAECGLRLATLLR